MTAEAGMVVRTCFLEVLHSGSVSQLPKSQDDVMVLVLPLCGVQQQGVDLLVAAAGVLRRLLILQPSLPQVRQVDGL